MYSKEELEAAGLGDFRVFLIQVWDYLGLPAPTKVQLDIAYWLQYGPKRAILQAFRGVGKSWITVTFVLWHLLLDPDKKIEVVSANEDLARDFTKFCLQLIRGMPLLQHLNPRADQLKSTEKFDVGPAKESKDPSVKSVGIKGQLTGSRADIIVADDIEVPKNSLTAVMRAQLLELVKEFDAVLKPLADARVLYLGTPQTEDSIYPKLEQRGYGTRIWPAEVPSNPEKYRGRLSKYVLRLIEMGIAPRTPVDPERFTRENLDERLLSYGGGGYALQFMLDTSPADAERRPLKLRDLMVMDVDGEMAPVKLVWGRDKAISDLQCGGLDGDLYFAPVWRSAEMAPYTGTVMAIDPSGRGKDETAYAIIKNLHGMLYCVAVGGFIDGFAEETLKSLAGVALRWNVNDIIIEENYGGGMFNALLKPHLIAVGLEKQKVVGGEFRSAGKIDEEWKGWSSVQKELRIINTLEPVLQSHRLVFDRRVIEDDAKVQAERNAYSLVQQMTRIERVKGALAHDDRLDALASAVSYYTERMQKDQNRALQQHKADLMDAELKKFIEGATGNLTRPQVHRERFR